MFNRRQILISRRPWWKIDMGILKMVQSDPCSLWTDIVLSWNIVLVSVLRCDMGILKTVQSYPWTVWTGNVLSWNIVLGSVQRCGSRQCFTMVWMHRILLLMNTRGDLLPKSMIFQTITPTVRCTWLSTKNLIQFHIPVQTLSTPFQSIVG